MSTEPAEPHFSLLSTLFLLSLVGTSYCKSLVHYRAGVRLFNEDVQVINMCHLCILSVLLLGNVEMYVT